MPRPLPDPVDVVRIDRLELPEGPGKGEGLFEWRHLKHRFTVDYPDLLKELGKITPGDEERIAERLMNFPRVFIVISTGEVFSDIIPEEVEQWPVNLPDFPPVER